MEDGYRPIGVSGEAPGVPFGDREVSNEPGFEELYRLEREPMIRLAYLLTGSAGVAQDLVHDAFLKIRPRLGSIDSPGGYLRTTVVNESRMWLRRRRREQAHFEPLPAVEEIAPETDDVWQTLHKLSPRQRSAVVLRYYLDLSTEDVAKSLGCRPSTARSLIRRGLHALREELEYDS